ncbi:PrpF domain-containing protein, partial [Escherichia coli]|uniref:PrpF domain-containing protein n=6 Tax=Escherichia coli TaxID=562 RepID=UPI000B2F67A3
MKKIPCVMMRGGTSRGAFLLAEHLPEDQTQRDKILMAIMGSGNDLEIDGIGGGNPLTSKVAIISRSSDPRADVDYLFAQVIVHEQRVDTTPNCGNMLSGVGAFAIENGLIAATSPVTRVRIRNVNTGTFIEADVQTPNGVVEYEGSARIDGVPGTAAPVALTFLNAAGTKTGKVFPTDNQIDYFDDVPVTCIDMAMPVVSGQMHCGTSHGGYWACRGSPGGKRPYDHQPESRCRRRPRKPPGCGRKTRPAVGGGFFLRQHRGGVC